jgi:hypothetical protein
LEELLLVSLEKGSLEKVSPEQENPEQENRIRLPLLLTVSISAKSFACLLLPSGQMAA